MAGERVPAVASATPMYDPGIGGYAADAYRAMRRFSAEVDLW